MLSLALFYLVAVICSARRTHALPLYPDTNLEPQADFIQKFVSEVEDGPNAAEGEQREVNNMYPLLMQRNGGRDSWNKGRGSQGSCFEVGSGRQTSLSFFSQIRAELAKNKQKSVFLEILRDQLEHSSGRTFGEILARPGRKMPPLSIALFVSHQAYYSSPKLDQQKIYF
ncbi:Hypothetical protein SMAX5B_009363 [Scophthalmus maximus]|uniref:Uncharacterized protein n=1 Tax=Scophthalmus maximus TaxID=52904 RepID=A0A2U9CAB4_SCOMX|nr:Hypothetical protein SMAX5B_009363 [Scophthalmus maximus]KAF0039894.1 hypothetical protein F2P81_008129 [Scophthalmus maximus]